LIHARTPLQRAAQRLDLVDLAAAVGIVPEELRPVGALDVRLLTRADLDEVEAVLRDEQVAVRERLGKWIPGIDEDDGVSGAIDCSMCASTTPSC
jgi:hypothetical protein